MQAEWSFVMPDVAIGGYRLQRRVGGGLSGTVFQAQHSRTERTVALKLMRKGEDETAAGQADASRRFETETRALHALAHPDIVQVLDGGLWQGRGWLVMEWLPGHDLSRYTTPARLLPEALTLEVGERLAHALAHAHARGVVHRDIKPGNVRVHLPAQMVKLADFGLARTLDSSATRTGVVAGSPAYMAPEMLGGAPADARTDFYALGVLLFELLAGQRPFEAQTLGEWLRLVATEPAPDLRQLKPELPAALASLVARLLQREAQGRLSSGADVAAELAQIRARWPKAADSQPHAHVTPQGARL
jgi:eukaryotic-like serine/threonine-protein kinase